jgi:uncharacterized protein YyaL (SSP411 family)
MRAGKGRYVLNVGRSMQGLARELHVSANDVKDRIANARAKMRRSRASRKAPRVDKRIFTARNATMASVFLRASAVLNRSDLRNFALKTIDRLMSTCYRNDIGLYHCLDPDSDKPRIAGLFADQAHMAQALLDAHALTGERKYLSQAANVIGIMRKEFRDDQGGGFHDRIPEADPLGRLAVWQKSMDDNAAAARCCLRLAHITGEASHAKEAQRTLGAFARSYEGREVAGAGYALAVQQLLHAPLRLVVVGAPASPATKALLSGCVRFYDPRKVVIALDPIKDADRIKALGLPANLRCGVCPCYGKKIGPPITDPDALEKSLKAFVQTNIKQEG